MKQTPALRLLFRLIMRFLTYQLLSGCTDQVENVRFRNIVVDNASSDATASIARRIGAVVVYEKSWEWRMPARGFLAAGANYSDN